MDSRNTLAECEIKSVLVRERYYRDSQQWDKLRASYHPDPSKTSIRISWFKGDINAFIAGSRAQAARNLTALHAITPMEVSFSSSAQKAFSVSVGSITVRFERSGADYDIVSHCRFLSRLEKVLSHSPGSGSGGAGAGMMEWKMLSMDVIYLQDSIVPAFPAAGGGSLVLQELEEGERGRRKSYRYLAWFLKERGLDVWDDLPGTDDEASVEAIMEWGLGWLDGETML